MNARYVVTTLLSALIGCAPPSAPKIGEPSNPSTGRPPVSGTTEQGTVSPVRSQGTISGGGGVGIRCDGRLEMLDVFEARARGLRFTTPANVEEAIQFVAQRFSDHYWNIETIPRPEHVAGLAKLLVRPIFEGKPIYNVRDDKQFPVREVDDLPLSNDFGRYSIPAKCRLEQVAFFDDSKGELAIVKSRYAELDLLSKSILAGHEVAYLVERIEGLEKLRQTVAPNTSENTREFIGRLLSHQAVPPRFDPEFQQLYRCQSAEKSVDDRSFFYAFNQKANGQLRLVFKSLFGKNSFYRMQADFPTSTLEIMLESRTTLDLTVPLQIVGNGSVSPMMINLTHLPNGDIQLSLKAAAGAPVLKSGLQQVVNCEKF